VKKTEELANLTAAFVATVKRLQFEAGVNDAELSRAINLDQGTLSRILTGKTTDPRLSTITAIAKFFSVPLSTLLAEPTDRFIPLLTQSELGIDIDDFFSKNNHRFWIKTENTSSQFAVVLDAKPRSEPLPGGTIIVIGAYATLTLGDLILYAKDKHHHSIIKISQINPLLGFDIETPKNRTQFKIGSNIVGKVIQISLK
jgi:transcriptional regulator with XRE-family HTH domain